jgi:hypothetical protein
MPNIRAFQRADLGAVVDLLRQRMPGWTGSEETLAGTTLDHPWADEELPSLVAVGNKGKILGFIGVQVRRLLFDGRLIRGVCATQLVVAAGPEAGPAGALMMSRVLSRPQELTWSDGATDAVVRMWRTFGGGDQDHVRACDWLLVLRPVRWLRGTVSAMVGHSLSRQQLPVSGLPFQAAGRTVARRAFPEISPDVHGEDATTKTLVENLPAIVGRFRVRVDHDEAYLDHMFRQIEAFSGPPVRRLVRHGERPIGWYAYLPGRRGASHVLHLAAAERHADAVLGELLAHARANGSALVAGRAEPHMMGALSSRMALLGYARQPTIHCKDPELALAMGSSASLLTRLDGEVFMT